MGLCIIQANSQLTPNHFEFLYTEEVTTDREDPGHKKQDYLMLLERMLEHNIHETHYSTDINILSNVGNSWQNPKHSL